MADIMLKRILPILLSSTVAAALIGTAAAQTGKPSHGQAYAGSNIMRLSRTPQMSAQIWRGLMRR